GRLLKTDQAPFWYQHALLRVQVGDVSGYRKVCRAMVERFRKSEDSDDLYYLCWACGLAPAALSDFNEVVRLVKKMVSSRPDLPGCHNAFGVILYRAGRLEDAVRSLDQSQTISGGSNLWVSVFLMMAHHRLKHTQEAQQWKELTAGLFERRFP